MAGTYLAVDKVSVVLGGRRILDDICLTVAEREFVCVIGISGGGKIVVVAFYRDRVALDLSAVVRKDISVFTSRGEGRNNVKRAIALAAQGKLRCAETVTHRFGLDKITSAFRVVRDRDGDPVKVVVIP